MQSSIDACLLFVAGKECKIGLPHSMSIHRGVMTSDIVCGVDYVVAFSLHFCILQVIKNWSQGRSGNEATAVRLRNPHNQRIVKIRG